MDGAHGSQDANHAGRRPDRGSAGGRCGETISFGLDGTAYEIDLSADNAAQLRDVFARYTEAGRKVSQPRRGAVGGAQRGAIGSGRSDLAIIRVWAKANGREVSERGRIKNTVIKAYDAVH